MPFGKIMYDLYVHTFVTCFLSWWQERRGHWVLGAFAIAVEFFVFAHGLLTCLHSYRQYKHVDSRQFV